MKYREEPATLYALVVGATLVLAGIIGFFYESAFTDDTAVRSAQFGLFDVNGWHNAVHIVTGLVALALARTRAREFALGFGVVYLVIAIWGFIVGDGASILSIVPVNTEDNVLHAVLAVSGFAAYAATAPARAGGIHPTGPSTA